MASPELLPGPVGGSANLLLIGPMNTSHRNSAEETGPLRRGHRKAGLPKGQCWQLGGDWGWDLQTWHCHRNPRGLASLCPGTSEGPEDPMEVRPSVYLFPLPVGSQAQSIGYADSQVS